MAFDAVKTQAPFESVGTLAMVYCFIMVYCFQSYMTQRPCLFTLINYCAIVFSFALMFANGWLTACDGFYDASACWLSYMKQ